MTQEGREAGRRCCEQAIALDLNYAVAYVVLAEFCLWSAFWGSTNPREAFSSAKSAALEALRFDDTIADAVGIGKVHRADDLRLGRTVALKFLPAPVIAAAVNPVG